MGEQIEKRWSLRPGREAVARVGPAPPDVAEAERIGDVHFAADNFAAALEYYASARLLADRAHAETATGRLDIKISDCHRRRGQLREALHQLETAKEALRPLGPTPDLGRVYARQGMCLTSLGRYERARKCLGVAYHMLRETSENEEIGNIELALGQVLTRTGDGASAREYFERALSTFRRIDYAEGIAHAQNGLGVTLKNACRWREALDCFGAALQLSETSGNYARTAHCCLNLGIVHIKTGEWGLAEQYLERALQTHSDVGNRSGVARALLAEATLFRRRHEWSRAEPALQRALEISRANGYAREETLALEFLGELSFDRGEHEAAKERLAEALIRAETLAPGGDLVNEVLRRLGDVTLALGDPETARSHGQRALEVSLRLGDLLERAACERLLGMCDWRLGLVETAEPHLATAVSLFAAASERFELGRTHLAAGRLFRERWSREPARGEWRDRALGHLGSAAEALLSLEGTPEAVLPLLELAELRSSIGLVDEAAADVLRAAGLVDPARDSGLAGTVDEVRRGVEGAIAQAPPETLPFGDSQEVIGSDGAGFGQLLHSLAVRIRCDRAALLAGSLANGAALEAVSLERFPVSDARSVAALLVACEPSLAEGHPLLCLDVRSDSRLRPIAATPLDGTASVLAIPLGPPGDPEGLLYLDRALGNVAGPFRRSEFHLAQTMAQLAWFGLVERQRRRLVRENRDLRDKLRGASDHFRDVVTQDPVMQETLRIVQRVGESDASVLLQGETGTGKGLIAEAIHRSSPRRDRSFVTINCAALPEGLLESELFGHVAGSFTGAVRDKRGLFEEAAGGTIFLDEVDKTSRTVQGKLLHVLDKREVRAVGSNRWVAVDVRVICATNAELMSCIEAGSFLEDLYYRLNDFVIRVPPLRERREDIPLLVEHFLDVFSGQLGKKPRGLSRAVLQRLMDHPWRGNVRELQKTVRRLVVLVDDGELIDEGLLPPEILVPAGTAGGANGKTLREEIARLEARMIREALENTGWNRAEVARRLHVSYPALLSKIRLHKLERRRR